MTIFIIDSENKIRVSTGSKREAALPGMRFETQRDLAALAAKIPGGRLVEIWNKLNGTTPVKKFTDRNAAVRRIWNAVQQLAPIPKSSIGGDGTLTARIVALLKRPGGASLKEIIATTGWQSHSVRGFISRLPKKTNLRIRSFTRNGERVYRTRA